MNRKNKIVILVIMIIVIIGIILFSRYENNSNLNNSLTTSDIDMNIDTDDGDEDIVWSNYEDSDIVLTNSISITEGGTYNLSGNIEEGLITINTDEDVKLVLNNVSITNSTGPTIYVEQAENVVIYIAEGTINTLTDGSNYSGYEEDVNGAIYSKDDIIFEGNGTLNIKANYQDGIVGKDDLKIISGNYIIDSQDDGIRGKDSVYILDGIFNITSGGDGIKSTNDTDTDKGFIKIENGTFNITSELDGMQAQTKLLIQNGSYNIQTGGGSSNSSTSSDDWGAWGKGRGAIQGTQTTDSDSSSAKGLKSSDSLVIENGDFSLNTSDDGIHSNNYVGIKDGNINMSSGDDGVHADTEIIIDGGTITIEKSYEGIEAAKITINGGSINVVSSDDGINVAGGNDSSSMNRPGQNNFNSSSDYYLKINDGTIFINAVGDGIDVNGTAYIYGGTTVVDGPSNSGNGALDYDSSFIVDGGILIAAGASGMLQQISSDSTQYNVTIYFDNSLSSGTKVSVIGAENNEVVTYTGSKTFDSIIISSPEFIKSSEYTIVINNENYTTFTIDSISTTVGGNTGFNNTSGADRDSRGGVNF